MNVEYYEDLCSDETLAGKVGNIDSWISFLYEASCYANFIDTAVISYNLTNKVLPKLWESNLLGYLYSLRTKWECFLHIASKFLPLEIVLSCLCLLWYEREKSSMDWKTLHKERLWPNT